MTPPREWPDLLALSRSGCVHFMGVGGAGMSALASFLVQAGGDVSGCDRKVSPACRRMEARGVRILEGHDPAHVQGASAFVCTAAIPSGHPELAAAREAGIPVLKRAEALGALVNRGTVVAIAGTHGKTTTTALTTGALEGAGLDPTALVGGRVTDWDGNVRVGRDDLFVVEADEFDRSFHTLRPSVAVITTLEADHLDIYGSVGEVEKSFLEFAELVVPDGTIVACADDPGVGRLVPRLRRRSEQIITYGLAAGSMVRADELETRPEGTSFRLSYKGRALGRVQIRLPGKHNVRNALAAMTVGFRLGGGFDALADGIARIAGVSRRFEKIGEAGGVLVIDDYAHHPTELAATIEAVRSASPGRRLVAVFQPHLYSRTRDFAEDFGRVLAQADVAFVTDVFAAREDPITGVSGELVADARDTFGGHGPYVAERERLVEVVLEELRAGDVCVTLGAGDLDDAAREILRHLQGGDR